VFISGQTTHITIEEEHPGGEDEVPTYVDPVDDEDFNNTGISTTHGHAERE